MLNIHFQSDTLLAIEKPPGLSTTSPPGTVSLESESRLQLNLTSGFLAAVHRLDRDVGGIVLIALTKKTARLLSQQFAARKVKKTYLAWVHGNVIQNQSIWRDALRKVPDEPRGEVCQRPHPDAKQAETHVEVQRFDPTQNRTLLKLSPITGRMHQLRLQTAFRDHPIVGDRLYGADDDNSIEHGIPIALRAQAITFHHPQTGKLVEVELPYVIPWT